MKVAVFNQWQWDWDFWGLFSVFDLTFSKEPDGEYDVQLIVLGLGLSVSWYRGK